MMRKCKVFFLNFFLFIYLILLRKVEPKEILDSIRSVKNKIEKVDIEQKITAILEKVADYSIEPDILVKVKNLDTQLNKIDFTLAKNLNKVKK